MIAEENLKKVVILALNGEAAVFGHALVHALELKKHGWEVLLMIAGEATRYIALLRNETKPYADLWQRVKQEGLKLLVCRTCARRNTVEPAAIEQDIAIVSEAEGHGGIAFYLTEGWQVLVF